MKTSIKHSIEYTNLSFNMGDQELQAFLKSAIQQDFHYVCVPPTAAFEARKLLRNEEIKIVTVIDYPMGYGYLPQKFEEAKFAIDYEVDELDVVLNHMNIASGKWSEVEEEVEGWGRFCSVHRAKVKLIVETEKVPLEDVLRISDFAVNSEIDYIKTATGINGKTSPEMVRAIRGHVGNKIGIKAAGGIKTSGDVLKMIEAGADRIGTSALIKL